MKSPLLVERGAPSSVLQGCQAFQKVPSVEESLEEVVEVVLSAAKVPADATAEAPVTFGMWCKHLAGRKCRQTVDHD